MRFRKGLTAFSFATLFAAAALAGCYEKESTTTEAPAPSSPPVVNVQPSKPDVNVNVPPSGTHSESSSTTVDKSAPGIGGSSTTTHEHTETH